MIPKQVLTDLQKSKKIVAVTHIHPDGDALGSLLAFASIMEGLGKEVFCLLEEPVSHLYHFLPDQERLHWDIDACRTFIHNAGDELTGVSLDCGDMYRIGDKIYPEVCKADPFVVLDHHASHKKFGTSRWVNEKSSSTGEMVYEIAEALGAEINTAAAYNLYVAILTDTGSFRYECTAPRTLHIAGSLLAKGVEAEKVSANIYDTYTPGRLQLLQKCLESLQLQHDNRIAIMRVSQTMLTETGCTMDDVEGFINFPRAIESVEAAVLLKEGTEGNIAVSLRAKGTVDVAHVASAFGGGGHRNAAGFRMQSGNLDEMAAKICTALNTVIFSGFSSN